MADLSSARREARRLIQNHSCRQTKIAMIEVLMCFAESSHEREELLQLTESLVEEITTEPSDETISLSFARSGIQRIDQIIAARDTQRVADLSSAQMLLKPGEESSAEEGIFQRFAGGGTQTTPIIDPSLWDTDPNLAHALLLSEETGYVGPKEDSHNQSKECSRRFLAEEAAFRRLLERMMPKERIKALQDRERSQKKR